ncbi:hypothetical protein DJ030_07610 [bacterium endosymbiont of Escarpia laminata]|nr:MAG: hypothetical protein DJ030_07610 [bacterium endosymbiont of Escarpia laminata]
MRSLFCGREKEMVLLKAAWERASNRDNPEPQLVVMVGESGLGKTRITQEFYNWLSTTHDATEPKGYWPDDLGQEANNLKVNPEPEACDNNEPMPYLWWGVRLTDPTARNTIQAGSALSTYLGVLTPHLKPVLSRLREVERQVEGGKTLAMAALDVGLSFIPGAGALGSIKTGAEALYELVMLGKESSEDQRMRTTGEIKAEEHKSQADMG